MINHLVAMELEFNHKQFRFFFFYKPCICGKHVGPTTLMGYSYTFIQLKWSAISITLHYRDLLKTKNVTHSNTHTLLTVRVTVVQMMCIMYTGQHCE